jgi:hypothetical protein
MRACLAVVLGAGGLIALLTVGAAAKPGDDRLPGVRLPREADTFLKAPNVRPACRVLQIAPEYIVVLGKEESLGRGIEIRIPVTAIRSVVVRQTE